MNALQGQPSPKFPPAVREQMIRQAQQLGLMQQLRQPYGSPLMVGMSPMQLAAMGNVANMALMNGAPVPTTYVPGQQTGGGKAGATPAAGTPPSQNPGAMGGGMSQAAGFEGQGGQSVQGGGVQNMYSPYSNLNYASAFIPPSVMSLMQVPGTTPNTLDPTWSPYYANTPAGQAAAGKLAPQLMQGNPWAQSHPDKYMALQDQAWVAEHPKKAKKYQALSDTSAAGSK